MHIPERMCIACRKMRPKSELIRIVRNDDAIEADKEGKKSGRGAYICKDTECIELAKKRKALSRQFKTKIDEVVYDEVLEAIKNE